MATGNDEWSWKCDKPKCPAGDAAPSYYEGMKAVSIHCQESGHTSATLTRHTVYRYGAQTGVIKTERKRPKAAA